MRDKNNELTLPESSKFQAEPVTPETQTAPNKQTAPESADAPKPETAPNAAKPRKQPTLLSDLIALTMKLAVIFAVFWLMFNYVFGVSRYMSANMTPSLRDGDLVLYFRMDQKYEAGDIAVFAYKGRTLMARVVAVAGDTVDFDEEGMTVNGSHVQEDEIYFETNMFEEGVTFPVRVGDKQIFVLGDNRPHATDSRIFGCVDLDDVAGKVIGLLRRRNL